MQEEEIEEGQCEEEDELQGWSCDRGASGGGSRSEGRGGGAGDCERGGDGFGEDGGFPIKERSKHKNRVATRNKTARPTSQLLNGMSFFVHLAKMARK
jgi:hypothetical protein